MTDQPRFAPARGNPDDAYRYYYGAPLVDLALRLCDLWLDARHSPRQR